MSLQDAILQIQALAPKAAGHLIRHQDWNTLIAALGEFGASLTSHETAITALQARADQLASQLTDVSSQVTALDGRVDDLEQSIQPLLGNYVVTLACDRQTYALGELCDITAKVTNLRGQPLPAPLPWVDFVASWGRLRAVPGFTSREGVGDNSLSVQVNAQGIARVRLRADHTEGFSETDEAQVDAVMHMNVPGTQMTVSEAFMIAATPTDSRARSAYTVLHREYDRVESAAVRNYADVYQMRNPYWDSSIFPGPQIQWRDYRATVIAMAKPDSDPLTPDGTRGAASIQVAFRDWLRTWGLEYLGDVLTLENEAFVEYGPLFDRDDVFTRFREKFEQRVENRGLLGRRKYMDATRRGLERINPAQQFGRDAKQQAIFAVAAQESNETRASERAPILDAHMGQGERTNAVRKDVGEVSRQVEETRGLQTTIGVLEGRMQSAERLGLEINSSLLLINDNVRQINPLDENSLRANVLKISADIAALKSRIS